MLFRVLLLLSSLCASGRTKNFSVILLIKNFIMSMGVLLAYKFVYHICTWFPKRAEEGTGAPGNL